MEDSADSLCTPNPRKNSGNSINLDTSRIVVNTPSKFANSPLKKFNDNDSLSNSPLLKNSSINNSFQKN